MKSKIFIFLWFSQLIFAQTQNVISNSFEYGIVIESSFLLNTEKELSLNNMSLQNEKSTLEFYPLSFYLTGAFFLNENIGIELKPGWVLGGDKFSAFEIGMFLKNYFWKKKLLGKIGANFHKNISDAHGTFESTDKSVLLIGLILGYKPISILTLTLSYYRPLSEYFYFGYGSLNNGSLNSNVESNTFLNQIFKLGVEIKL